MYCTQTILNYTWAGWWGSLYPWTSASSLDCWEAHPSSHIHCLIIFVHQTAIHNVALGWKRCWLKYTAKKNKADFCLEGMALCVGADRMVGSGCRNFSLSLNGTSFYVQNKYYQCHMQQVSQSVISEVSIRGTHRVPIYGWSSHGEQSEGELFILVFSWDLYVTYNTWMIISNCTCTVIFKNWRKQSMLTSLAPTVLHLKMFGSGCEYTSSCVGHASCLWFSARRIAISLHI